MNECVKQSTFYFHIPTDSVVSCRVAGFVDIWSNSGQTSPVHSFSCSNPISALCCSKTEPLVVVAYSNCIRVEVQGRGKEDWTCGDIADFQGKVRKSRLVFGLIPCMQVMHSGSSPVNNVYN